MSGKQQTAATLAKECEKFSDELLDQAEFLNDVALAHAESYIHNWEDCVSAYVDTKFPEILSRIERLLLEAVALQVWKYNAAPRMKEQHLRHVDGLVKNPVLFCAIRDVENYLTPKLNSVNLSNGGDEVFRMLWAGADITPFTKAALGHTLDKIKRRKLIQAPSNQAG